MDRAPARSRTTPTIVADDDERRRTPGPDLAVATAVGAEQLERAGIQHGADAGQAGEEDDAADGRADDRADDVGRHEEDDRADGGEQGGRRQGQP